MKVYRVTNDGREAAYIRAESAPAAMAEYNEKHYKPATAAEPVQVDGNIYAVYFTDSGEPAYFKGTKADATRGARLYIKQWQLRAEIDKIIKI